jgi:hypothetical protein
MGDNYVNKAVWIPTSSKPTKLDIELKCILEKQHECYLKLENGGKMLRKSPIASSIFHETSLKY